MWHSCWAWRTTLYMTALKFAHLFSCIVYAKDGELSLPENYIPPRRYGVKIFTYDVCTQQNNWLLKPNGRYKSILPLLDNMLKIATITPVYI